MTALQETGAQHTAWTVEEIQDLLTGLSTDRMPGTLFAEIATPRPVPHMRIALSASPLEVNIVFESARVVLASSLFYNHQPCNHLTSINGNMRVCSRVILVDADIYDTLNVLVLLEVFVDLALVLAASVVASDDWWIGDIEISQAYEGSEVQLYCTMLTNAQLVR